MKKLSVVLTIAGSDSSGGAGIQADLKTMSAFGVYGMSVITAVTAQNTCGVTGVQSVTGEMIRLQLEAVLKDIKPDAVKIGMLSTAEAVEAVADLLEEYQPSHIVLDPVMVSTSGRCLLEPEGERLMLERLFPMAELVTPNIPEIFLQGRSRPKRHIYRAVNRYRRTASQPSSTWKLRRRSFGSDIAVRYS